MSVGAEEGACSGDVERRRRKPQLVCPMSGSAHLAKRSPAPPTRSHDDFVWRSCSSENLSSRGEQSPQRRQLLRWRPKPWSVDRSTSLRPTGPLVQIYKGALSDAEMQNDMATPAA